MSEGDFSGERGSGRTWIEAGQEGGLPGTREEPARGSPADLGFTPNEQRVKDLAVLHALCDDTLSSFGGGLTEKEREAFESMRDALEAPVRKFETLSPKQREWAVRRADEMDLDVRTPAERNANVPRGREVESRAAQLGLPLAPPGRRAGQGLDALFEPGGPFEIEAGRAVQGTKDPESAGDPCPDGCGPVTQNASGLSCPKGHGFSDPNPLTPRGSMGYGPRGGGVPPDPPPNRPQFVTPSAGARRRPQPFKRPT